MAVAAVVASAGFALLALRAPEDAPVVLALVVLAAVALFAPLGSLAVLLFLTVLVPADLHDLLSVGAAPNRPGLVLLDVFVLLGVCRCATVAIRRRWFLAVCVAAVLAVLIVAQLANGIADGAAVSDAGVEARRLALGVAGFLFALPVLERSALRNRLWGVLLALGLTLGAWGLLQWFAGIAFSTTGDVGVREGVALTTSGRGQLQGGLYAYPSAVILAFSALISGHLRSAGARAAVSLVLALNGACLLLTFERTFWFAAVLGCGVVAVLSHPAARRRAVVWSPVALVLGVLALGLAAPGQLRTAGERLVSVSQYQSDSSVGYRREESGTVVAQIAARPLTGAGLGSTITWGHAWQFGRLQTPYSHNGYLWLAWKAGILPMVLTVMLLVAAVVRRSRHLRGTFLGAMRVAAQASILGLLVINITFPTFNTLGITAGMGVLVALCWRPRGVGT